MAQEQSYGGFWARLIAHVLDYAVVLFLLLAAAIGMATVQATTGMDAVMGALAGLVSTLVPLLYWSVQESSAWQATIGKRIMGLQVTDADGARLGFVRALLRTLAKILSWIPFGLGFVMAAFMARKQALHDVLVQTLEVRSGPSQLWKLVLALVVGLVLMAASAAALFHYFLQPAYRKTFGDTIQAAAPADGRPIMCALRARRAAPESRS